MDPFTLFALANGAVSAVKAGCKLYKDIKGTAGEVKDILKDLDKQFNKQYEGKPVPKQAQQQLQEEKARVVELSKKDPSDIYTEIGNHLGVYFENMAKCMAIFAEEERRSKELYTGEESLGKRALQRVLMRKKLEQMATELRQLLIYESPPELGALYTDVSEMMEKINKEQTIALAKKMREDYAREQRKKRMMRRLYAEAVWGVVVVVLCAWVGLLFALVVEDRIKKYPHLGTDWIPKSEVQQRTDAIPPVYIGR
jgi:hypothetical protein